MASVVQKLVRKSLPTRVITALNNKPQASNLLIHHPHVGETKVNFLTPYTINQIPFSGSPKASDAVHIYLSFPFGFCLNPISLTGLVQSEPNDVTLGDSQTVWADSVKKKRKRKMNKHKYKKLRKRLQRQTQIHQVRIDVFRKALNLLILLILHLYLVEWKFPLLLLSTAKRWWK